MHSTTTATDTPPYTPCEEPKGMIWVTPRANQGQIVEISYSNGIPAGRQVNYDADHGDRYRRVLDRSDNTATYSRTRNKVTRRTSKWDGTCYLVDHVIVATVRARPALDDWEVSMYTGPAGLQGTDEGIEHHRVAIETFSSEAEAEAAARAYAGGRS